jgi:Cu/Ag efflux protein CusF
MDLAKVKGPSRSVGSGWTNAADEILGVRFAWRCAAKVGMGTRTKRQSTKGHNMKTLRTLPALAAISLGAAVLSMGCASQVVADETTNTQVEQNHDKTYEGSVTDVDPEAKTVSVKGFLISKTFHTAEPCKFSLEDKPGATLNDIRPGQKVEVHYQNVQGVLAASQITQHDIMLHGYITTINPGQRTLVLKDRAGTRKFVVAEDCSIVLNDEQVGTLENLKVGHSVSVAYEPTAAAWTAHKIEQKAESFTGTIEAIDAGARTVTAKSFMSVKKFDLGDNCQIVVADKLDAALRDLRIGDRVEFSYEDANGVLVANRIGRDANLSKTEIAPTAKIND